MKRPFIRTLLLLSVFMICGAPNIYFESKVPAILDLPNHIHSIGLFDRSMSDNKMVNFLEKGLLGALSDKGSPPSKTCIDGLYDRLSGYNDIEVIRTNLVNKRPGTSMEFPAPVDWQEVNSLCREFKVDAILVLELFDVQMLSDEAEVKAGYRLYDPKSMKILDEFQFYQQAGWKQPITTIEGAVMRVTSEDQAIHEASYQSGYRYGGRITPTWYRVERKYYDKSKRDDNLAEGARMMEVNDWDAAIAALERAYETGHRKTKGRSAHNMAVVYEILGDFNKAKEWAQIAWGRHENKESKDYVQILNQRMRDAEVLEYQENN